MKVFAKIILFGEWQTILDIVIMALLNIINPSDPVLRRKAKKVTRFDGKLQNLIDNMIETMHDAPGIGLAAPQVSESLRLFVAHVEEDPDDENNAVEGNDITIPGLGRMHVIINPRITYFSSESTVRTEGCLSLPGYLGDVCRALEISVKYTDRHGQKRKLNTNGWMARVIQHEYDHLEGELFIDKAEKIWLAEQDLEDEGKTSN